MITVAELVEQLDGIVSQVTVRASSASTPVTRVLLPDPGDDPVVEPGDLVIGVGVLAGSSAERLLSHIAGAGGAALIARDRTATMLAADAERLGLTLLAVPESASWIQITQLISSAVSGRNPGTLAEALPTGERSRVEHHLLERVLRGGHLAVESAGRLGLPGPRFIVVAAAPADDSLDGALPQLRDLMAIQLSCHRRVFATIVDSVVYGVMSVSSSTEQASGTLHEGLNHLAQSSRSSLGCEVMVGIGHVVQAASEIASSRGQADRVLRVLRAERRTGVADAGQVASKALLLTVADSLRRDPSLLTPPIKILERHDLQNHTNYLQTLAAYLGAFGSIDAAAQRLGVHGNTVRYRLRQIQNVTGLDLSDPDDRLALMLQLRLLA